MVRLPNRNRFQTRRNGWQHHVPAWSHFQNAAHKPSGAPEWERQRFQQTIGANPDVETMRTLNVPQPNEQQHDLQAIQRHGAELLQTESAAI